MPDQTCRGSFCTLSGIGWRALAVRASCVALLLAIVHPVVALTIHYADDRDEQLRRCDEFSYAGEAVAAENCYRQLLDTGREEDALLRAQAARALGDVRLANRLFREASVDNRDPAIKTAWGELYLDTHQISDAVTLFREALLFDADYLPARLGLAAALAESFEGKAREELESIVTEYPHNVRALLLLARIELELQNIISAQALLNRALLEAGARDIVPLEIHALQAAVNLLEGKPLHPWTERALAINPRYGDVYSIPAHFYIITYRYREAVSLYQQAVATDPALAEAHRDLGINLLRINDVFGARHHLGKAYALDPFDAQTVNTLRLLDGIDNMRLSSVDVPDPQRPGELLGRILLRLDREDADALEPYVIDLATHAVQTFSERYDFRLAKPMIVELYHDHDDFGVRTVSTPGIGLLGVTFGYLTAMDSPKARAAGEFHWGSTLWHEIAHVFTLEATNHRLPRWFSEGLSVYEEWNTGPLSDRELSLEVLGAIQSERLLPVASLDAGFVRPVYPGQVQVSYMQAGLICDFIAQRFGHVALVAMLGEFADGADTASALETAIGLDDTAFDALFAEYLQTRYGDIVAGLDDYRVASRQLGRAVQAEDWVSVEALARDMIRRYPERVAAGSPYEWLAAAQTEQDQPAEALDTLLEWHRLGGHDPATLQRLAGDLQAAGRFAAAAQVFESLNWVMPYDREAHRWLGEHYLSEERPDLALREFDALLGLSPDDPAMAYLGRAKSALLKEDTGRARREVLRSLETAPFFRPAQHLLLHLITGDPVD